MHSLSMSATDVTSSGTPATPPPDVARLAEQLSRFEALFEAVPLAIALFDESLRLVRANTSYRELTGVDAGIERALSIYDAFPNALADCAEQIDAAARGTTPPPRRLTFHSGARPRVVEATFTPLGTAHGARGIIFVGHDVTEREQLRDDLSRSMAQLESIFDVLPDAVRVVDAEGSIIRSNGQAQAADGVSPGDSVQSEWRRERPRMLDGTTLFPHEHPTARALRGERVRGQTLEVRRLTGGTSVIIEVNADPLRDEAGHVRGAVTVERDVTERARLAQALTEQAKRTAELYERVSTEAERLERMVSQRTRELLALQEARARDRRLAAVGQLAAGVMHDVNNALSPIMAAAYLLEANADDPVAVRDYAARVARTAETGTATAARVGRFIRQEPLSGNIDELVDLSALADEVVAMTRPLWAERAGGGVVQLERSLAGQVVVRGIAGELREALLNLVQNALDAMVGGGTLGISTIVAGPTAIIEIRDSGVGMTSEVRERAFEPFFTTKGSKGSGLGLAEVYGIVKRHRGDAVIESEPGRGTVVRLALPATVGMPSADTRAAAPRGGIAPRRILVVEDHHDGREFMRALLLSDGHTVDTASTIAEALAHLEAEAVPYDVLVTDIGLPDGSGWDLVARMRRDQPTLRIGVVTGWELDPGDQGGVANFLLRKPVRTHELLALVTGEREQPQTPR
ncbi:MAG: hypothetical protein NVS4B3_05340 [Gemmatimonadaceae bacterium]